MEKDLKGLIDVIDQENKTQSILERKIESLKEEINRLKFTIQEQKLLIQSLKDNDQQDDLGVDDDIQLLKDMIYSQRQDILKKDRDVEILKQTIEHLQRKAEDLENESSIMEDLKAARIELERLTTEIEMYRANDENAKSLLKQLSEENEELTARIEDIKEHGFIQEDIRENKSVSTQQVDQLLIEIEDYQAQIISLQQSLESAEKASFDLKEKYEIQLNHLNASNEAYEAEIESLRAQINNLVAKREDEDLTRLEVELERRYEQIQELQERINKQEVKLNETLRINEEFNTELIESKKSAKKKKKKKKKGEEETEDFSEQLKLENEELKEEIVELNQEIERITSINIAQSSKANQANNGDTLENTIFLLESEKQELKDALRDEKNNSERILFDIEEQIKKIAYMEEELNQKSAQIAELNALNDDFKLKYEDSQDRLNSISDMNRDENESLKKDNEQLLETISMIKEEKDTLEYQITELQEEKANHLELIQTIENENKNLLEQLEQVRQDASDQSIDVGLNQDFDVPFSNDASDIIQDLKAENQKQTAEIKKLKTELSIKLSDEEELKQSIISLKGEIMDLKSKVTIQTSMDYSSNITSQNLNMTVIDDMGDTDKEKLIFELLNDIKSDTTYEMKKRSIATLARIKHEKIFSIFSELINDTNWMIRFHVVKALKNMKIEESKKLLEILSNDTDIDVREAAQEALSKQ